MKCDHCGTENWEGNALCGKCNQPFGKQQRRGLVTKRVVSLLILCSAFAGAAGFAAATFMNQQDQASHATLIGSNRPS